MTGSAPWRRVDPRIVDATLALASLVVMVVSASLVASGGHAEPLRWWGLALLVVESGAILIRRRHPLAGLLVAGACAAAYGIAPLPDPVAPVGLLVMFGSYISVASWPNVALAGPVALISGIIFTIVPGDSDALDYFAAITFLTFAGLLGVLARTRREYLAEVEARTAQLERDQQRAAERAVLDERTRLARELHDVVAHHVSLMVVQCEAGAAGADDPAPFDAVAGTGRAALTELRRMVALLREDDDRAPNAPQPGIADLPRLVDDVRRAGLPVEVGVEGEARPVSAGVDLSAYRIVQEALTNTMKHAGTARAQVTVRWRPDALELRVADDGGGAAARRDGDGGEGGHEGDRGHGGDRSDGGHGLVGIAERVHLFGGSLSTGPGPAGGFVVEARLPTGAA